MRALVKNRLMLVWVALSAITVGYLFLDRSAEEDGVSHASVVVTINAIVLALVKVRVIMREFMEVRHAPDWLRRLTDGWVLLVGAVLLAAYFAGRATA